MASSPPQFDAQGLHILDPRDSSGHKSHYISILQEKALERYLPRGNATSIAVDLGCGYGRLSASVARKGWRVIGIDPDETLLNYARQHTPEVEFKVGGLPEIPVEPNSVGLMLIHNLLRALLLRRLLHLAPLAVRYLAPDGCLIVVENIRDGHLDYIPEDQLIELFTSQGLKLRRRIPIRAARWWMVYAIRYGLVPERFLDRIADYELNRMATHRTRPRRQYVNVMFLFDRANYLGELN